MDEVMCRQAGDANPTRAGIFALQTASFVWYTLIVSVSSQNLEANLKYEQRVKRHTRKERLNPFICSQMTQSQNLTMSRLAITVPLAGMK